MMIKLALRNLLQKPLTTLLSLVLLAVSVGIISMILLLQEQFEKQFTENIEDVDMVIGAKGSPLQLILSAIYHIDAPTGNISYTEAEKWMHHPWVAKAIPLAYGDSYKGYSIVGTTRDYTDKYCAVLEEGTFNEKDFEVVAGSAVAKKLNLKPGSQFYSTHGLDEQGEEHKDQPYTVTGILKAVGTVPDNLLLGNIESVWKLHEHHHHDDEDRDHHPSREGTQHKHEAEPVTGEEHQDTKELTAVLLQFSNPIGIIQLPRLINSQTNMMAALPAIELNRLFALTGIGISTLKWVGSGILLLSGFSIFISLLNSLKERKYELALMRTLGANRLKLFVLLLLESLGLCVAGFLAGIMFSRLALGRLSAGLESSYRLEVQPWALQATTDLPLFALIILLGLLAALFPAIKAFYINIPKILSHD